MRRRATRWLAVAVVGMALGPVPGAAAEPFLDLYLGKSASNRSDLRIEQADRSSSSSR